MAKLIYSFLASMFPDGLRQPLELVDERRFAGGMVFLHYAVL